MPNKKSGVKRKREASSGPSFFQPAQSLLSRPLLEREIALTQEIQEKYSVGRPGTQEYFCLLSAEYVDRILAVMPNRSQVVRAHLTEEEHRHIQEKYGIQFAINRYFLDTRPSPIAIGPADF